MEEHDGKKVIRYVFKTTDGRTVRQFRTNDESFFLRTYARDKSIHGELVVWSELSSSPMHPFVEGGQS